MNFIIKSLSFKKKDNIPAKYTCEGDNISPSLEWENPPLGTKSFVLLVDDYDTPYDLWNHWLIYNIPKNVNGLEEDIKSLPEPAKLGKNSWKKKAYCGPYPMGQKQHTYYFKLFALDDMLKPHHRLARTNIEEVIKHHVLEKATLTGLYSFSKESIIPHHNHDIVDAMTILKRKDVDQRIKEKAYKEIEEDIFNK
jgi:Raf kinase inhibitor-like YbhB/YbcL family protein